MGTAAAAAAANDDGGGGGDGNDENKDELWISSDTMMAFKTVWSWVSKLHIKTTSRR